MPQETAFGVCEMTTYIKVNKTDGSVRYYKVADGKNIEIDEKTYYLCGGQ